MTDFEKAAMNAFGSKFHDAEIAGCFFHLGQSVWRKIQKITEEGADNESRKLAARYKNEPEFAIRIRKFLALAYVPLLEVHNYMDMLMADEITRNDGLVAFIDYFQKTYIGQRVMGVESDATFPYRTWNMYERTKNDLPRTNNSLEGWHHAFALNVIDHPKVHELASKYRLEQNSKAIKRQQHLDGKSRPHQRTKYRRVTEGLKEAIDQLETGAQSGLTYLETIARKMSFRTY